MALKDILVCLDPTEAGERRLRLAAAIAREHHAHLSAAYLLSEAIPGVPPYEGAGIPLPPARHQPLHLRHRPALSSPNCRAALPCGGSAPWH